MLTILIILIDKGIKISKIINMDNLFNNNFINNQKVAIYIITTILIHNPYKDKIKIAKEAVYEVAMLVKLTPYPKTTLETVKTIS
jgi:hypothetical protein